MNDISARKLDTIRKLLAKAEGTDNADEAEIFNAKARELIVTHGIDEALLAAEGKTRDAIGSITVFCDPPYARDKGDLLTAVALPLGCRSIMFVHRGGQQGRPIRHVVYGYLSDLERIELLYTSLLVQAATQLVAIGPRSVMSGESVAAYRRTWFYGFNAAIFDRLTAAAQAGLAAAEAAQEAAEAAGAVASSVGVALAVRSRVEDVQAHFDEQHPDLKPAARRRLSGTGYADGALAGAKADIGQRRVGGSRTAIG